MVGHSLAQFNFVLLECKCAFVVHVEYFIVVFMEHLLVLIPTDTMFKLNQLYWTKFGKQAMVEVVPSSCLVEDGLRFS